MPLKRCASTAVQAFLTDGGPFQPADSLMTDAAKGLSTISEQPMLIGDELAKQWLSDPLSMKKVLLALFVLASSAPAAMAQKEIPKAPGHDQCPLGYVNTLGTTCVSPIYYEVAPTNGKACMSGWMNIGAGYCKKKTLGIF